MRATPDVVHGTAEERLRGDRQRYTDQRRTIVSALHGADRPVTVVEILADLDGMAQSSLYRNLSVLEDAGVVHRLVTSDDTARYELAEDLTGHHHHLICDRCGAIVDFDVPTQLEDGVTALARAVADAHGFRVEHHRLDLTGTCRDCLD